MLLFWLESGEIHRLGTIANCRQHSCFGLWCEIKEGRRLLQQDGPYIRTVKEQRKTWNGLKQVICETGFWICEKRGYFDYVFFFTNSVIHYTFRCVLWYD